MRGRMICTRSCKVGGPSEAPPRSSSCSPPRAAARAPASRSQRPKWRYLVQAEPRKTSGSAPAQRRSASKHARRTSWSTSFEWRLSRETPRLSRAAPRSCARRRASWSSPAREDCRVPACWASASRTWVAAASQNSRSARHWSPRPSTTWRPAVAATWRTLRNWHLPSATIHSRSTCRRPPLRSRGPGAAAVSSRQRLPKASRTRAAPRSRETSQC
mmetsp:Transcript_39296/g.116439  ORF Transcript_39296/g.116439 Transcript_39296/m.116439 type:complete len:216 (+) Transcript_39296:2237-2884(+)